MAIPDPLHPFVVHFPVALAVLIPLLALTAAWSIRRGVLPRSAWAAVVALHVLLVGSAWLAVETGESEEERVETVVAKRHIEAHEEAGERFLLFCAVPLPLVALGLAAGPWGRAARLGTLLVTLAVLGAGVGVGHSGGQLVHRYGAPRAYATGDAPGAPAARGAPAERSVGEDSDSDSHGRDAAPAGSPPPSNAR